MRTINNELIRSFEPCYDPSKHDIPDNETLPTEEWVSKYREIVPDKDILWLLLREHFYSAKDLRLFAVWCAREALKLVANPDLRSVEACNVAERYANGDATDEELNDAWDAANDAAWAANNASWHAAWAAKDASWDAKDAAWAARNTAIAAATATTYCDIVRKQQLNYLLSTFTML